MKRARIGLLIAFGLGAAACLPGSARAQAFPAPGGAEVRLGFAAPRDLPADELTSGRSLSADLDLGYVGRPWLRVLAGVGHFRTDIESGDTAVGDAGVVSVRGALRADAFPGARLTASLLASANIHSVSASVPEDANVEELLDGVYAGVSLGVGARWALDAERRASLVAEARRTFVTNVGHWAFEAGIRYLFRGARAYEEAPAPVPQRADTSVRAAGPGASGARARDDRDERGDAPRVGIRVEAGPPPGAEGRPADAAAPERPAIPSAGGAAPPRLGEALRDIDRLHVDIVGVAETERGLVVTLGAGVFASGQPSLTDQARGGIGRIAAILGRYPDRRILVEGHTDSVGDEEANLALSERRAGAVREALIAGGIEAARVRAAGYGETRPLSDNETPAGRAANRRVEIIVLNP